MSLEKYLSYTIGEELKTCSIQLAEEFLLEDPKNYRYLTAGNVSVADQDDAELYRQLVEAMDIMAFTKEEQDC